MEVYLFFPVDGVNSSAVESVSRASECFYWLGLLQMGFVGEVMNGGGPAVVWCT